VAAIKADICEVGADAGDCSDAGHKLTGGFGCVSGSCCSEHDITSLGDETIDTIALEPDSRPGSDGLKSLELIGNFLPRPGRHLSFGIREIVITDSSFLDRGDCNIDYVVVEVVKCPPES
jgi:hypothetical protein